MTARFHDRIIMVTGASGGLGGALCAALGAQGASVIALARDEEGLAATRDAVETAGGRCLCVPFDLLDFGDYDKLFLALKDQIPHLDGLVHAAGNLDRCRPMRYTETKEFRRMLDLHLTAPNMLTRSMYPLLERAAAASILFITCDMVARDQPNWHGYGMAKRALAYAAAMWQAEHPNSPMRFNALNPGRMRTALMKRAYPGLDETTIPAAAEAMPALLHLLSDEGREIRGECLHAGDVERKG